jgi:hypothetical protein
MKFEIDFGNVETGARKTITVILTPAQIAEIRAGNYEDHNVIFMAKALQLAYREREPGFFHLRDGIRAVHVQ